MDEKTLNEIETRWQFASMKPWYVDKDFSEGGSNQILDANGLAVCLMAHDSSGLVDEFDTDFIVHCASDIPALIAEVRRLKALLEEATK